MRTLRGCKQKKVFVIYQSTLSFERIPRENKEPNDYALFPSKRRKTFSLCWKKSAQACKLPLVQFYCIINRGKYDKLILCTNRFIGGNLIRTNPFRGKSFENEKRRHFKENFLLLGKIRLFKHAHNRIRKLHDLKTSLYVWNNRIMPSLRDTKQWAKSLFMYYRKKGVTWVWTEKIPLLCHSSDSIRRWNNTLFCAREFARCFTCKITSRL